MRCARNPTLTVGHIPYRNSGDSVRLNTLCRQIFEPTTEIMSSNPLDLVSRCAT